MLNVALELECCIGPSRKVTLETTDIPSVFLVEERQSRLFTLAGPLAVIDDEQISDLPQHAHQIIEATKLSQEDRNRAGGIHERAVLL